MFTKFLIIAIGKDSKPIKKNWKGKLYFKFIMLKMYLLWNTSHSVEKIDIQQFQRLLASLNNLLGKLTTTLFFCGMRGYLLICLGYVSYLFIFLNNTSSLCWSIFWLINIYICITITLIIKNKSKTFFLLLNFFTS